MSLPTPLRLVWFRTALAAVLLAALVPVVRAEEVKAPRKPAAAAKDEAPQADKLEFLRFVEDGKGGGTLEAAIASYENADGVTVHLVAALHVGERSYYEGLAKTFEDYDALLYELVKPKDAGAPPPPERRAIHALGTFQQWLKETLELEFQLDAMDYTKPNFVHADLDAETFLKLQDERGESLFSLMLRTMITEMARQRAGKGAPPIGLIDILVAMSAPDSARQYKLLLARQFQDLESKMAGLEGPNGSVILTERNKAALRVMGETIEAGKRNLGIFYGAGHMRGLEDALLEMGFRRVGVKWRVAWDMRDDGKGKGKPRADAKGRERPKARAETQPTR